MAEADSTSAANACVADEKGENICRVANDLYCQKPDWATFFREILGLRGLIRRTYPTAEALVEFERTDAYQNVQQLLKNLRERRLDGPQEPTRVITVRLPKSLHEALRAEAHEHQTSMNKLCISKLLQFIDDQLVPVDSPDHSPIDS